MIEMVGYVYLEAIYESEKEANATLGSHKPCVKVWTEEEVFKLMEKVRVDIVANLCQREIEENLDLSKEIHMVNDGLSEDTISGKLSSVEKELLEEKR